MGGGDSGLWVTVGEKMAMVPELVPSRWRGFAVEADQGSQVVGKVSHAHLHHRPGAGRWCA